MRHRRHSVDQNGSPEGKQRLAGGRARHERTPPVRRGQRLRIPEGMPARSSLLNARSLHRLSWHPSRMLERYARIPVVSPADAGSTTG